MPIAYMIDQSNNLKDPIEDSSRPPTPSSTRSRSRLRRPSVALSGAGRRRPGARRRDPPGRVPRRRPTLVAEARRGTAPRSTPDRVPAQRLPQGRHRRPRLGARRDRTVGMSRRSTWARRRSASQSSTSTPRRRRSSRPPVAARPGHVRRLGSVALARAPRQRPPRARPRAPDGADRLDRRRRLGRRLRPARRAGAAALRPAQLSEPAHRAVARRRTGLGELSSTGARGPADADQHHLPARRPRPNRARPRSRLLMLPSSSPTSSPARPSASANAGTTGLLDVATGTWAAISRGGRRLTRHPPSSRGSGTAARRASRRPSISSPPTTPHAPSPPAPWDQLTAASSLRAPGSSSASSDQRRHVRDRPHRQLLERAGAAGGYRFLKNVPGFWLLERCAAEWETSPHGAARPP